MTIRGSKRAAPKRLPRQDEGLKRGEGSIKERARADGTVSFQARWSDDDIGRSERTKTFATRDAAEDFLREQMRAKRDGRYQPPSTVTIKQLVETWLERGKSRWSASTGHTYRTWASCYVYPEIGGWLVGTLTPAKLQHWVDRAIKSDRSATTVDAGLRVVRMAFREAAMIGLITVNPAQGLRGPSVARAEHETWDVDEVARVLAHVAADPMWNAIYRLALTSGMRPGELRALRWSDLDEDRGAVHVQRTMTKDVDGHEIIGTTTKTRRSRLVALPASTVAALVAWRASRKIRRIGANDLMFGGESGAVLTEAAWTAKQDEVTAKTGVTAITPHGLRHSNATLELEAGTHPRVVAERLGHASVAMTLDVYSHVSVDLQKAAADALDARLTQAEKSLRSATTSG